MLVAYKNPTTYKRIVKNGSISYQNTHVTETHLDITRNGHQFVYNLDSMEFVFSTVCCFEQYYFYINKTSIRHDKCDCGSTSIQSLCDKLINICLINGSISYNGEIETASKSSRATYYGKNDMQVEAHVGNRVDECRYMDKLYHYYCEFDNGMGLCKECRGDDCYGVFARLLKN